MRFAMRPAARAWRSARCVLVAGALLGLLPARAHAGLTLPMGFRDSLVCGGLGLPVAMAFVPGPVEKGPRVLLLEPKLPRLRLVVNGVLQPPPPLGMISEVDWLPGEAGALSLALDPGWPARPFVYVHYTSVYDAIHLVRYRMTGDLAYTTTGIVEMDSSSKMILLDDIPDVNQNHNGGCLRFGPDGMLYMTTGDDQQSCLAQDTTSLAGKLLRLDVSRLPDTGRGPFPHALLTPADNPHATSPDEHYRLVHSVGLRNPFRMHIDPVDGGLFVADVGQVTYEEVNRVTSPANFGWPWYENTTPLPFSCGPAPPAGLTDPIATLVNPPSRSVISLGPYRAPAGAAQPFPPDYEGDYLFADYFSGLVRRIGSEGGPWTIEPAAGQPTASEWATGALQVVDAAIAPDGSLWYLLQGVNFAFSNGELHRVSYGAAPDTLAAAGPPTTGVALAAPSPNPMRAAAAIPWTLRQSGEVLLEVLDAGGRRIVVLESGLRAAGHRRTAWDARDARGLRVPPGVYHVRLRAAGQSHTRRLVVSP